MPNDIEKTATLEHQLQTHLFTQPIEMAITQAQVQGQRRSLGAASNLFDMGCGAIYGCGL